MDREDWMRFFLNLRFVSMNVCGMFIFIALYSMWKASAISTLIAGAALVVLPILLGTVVFAHGQLQSLAPAQTSEQAEVA
jgi:hypothetical protein